MCKVLFKKVWQEEKKRDRQRERAGILLTRVSFLLTKDQELCTSFPLQSLLVGTEGFVNSVADCLCLPQFGAIHFDWGCRWLCGGDGVRPWSMGGCGMLWGGADGAGVVDGV